MLKRKRSIWRDLAEYLVARVLLCFLQAMPLSIGYSLARGMGWLAYQFDRRHRLVADENLRIAYPQWSAAERDRTIRQVYVHFCKMMIEMAHLPRMLNAGNWRKYLDTGHCPDFVGALLSGRPVLVVTGHHGNWEMAAYGLGLLGFKSYAIARPLDNRLIDVLLTRFRRKCGQELFNKNGDATRMIELLQRGGILCTLADQDAGPRGVFVPFFGKPASTHKAVAQMALRYDALAAVVTVRRIGEGLRYLLDVETVLDCRSYTHDAQGMEQLTRDHVQAWERLVAKAPEQYLWLHRRWKHSPPESVKQRLAA